MRPYVSCRAYALAMDQTITPGSLVLLAAYVLGVLAIWWAIRALDGVVRVLRRLIAELSALAELERRKRE